MEQAGNDQTAALQEIAALLRRRVEQEDEKCRCAQEAQERIKETFGATKDLKMPHFSQMEERIASARDEREQSRAEDRAFKVRLLAELERHNALIERLLARLDRR